MKTFSLDFRHLLLIHEIQQDSFIGDVYRHLDWFWSITGDDAQVLIREAQDLGLIEEYFLGDDQCLKPVESFPFKLTLRPSNQALFLLWAAKQAPSHFELRIGASAIACHLKDRRSYPAEDLRAAINSLPFEKQPWAFYLREDGHIVVVAEFDSRTHLGIRPAGEGRVSWLSWKSEPGNRLLNDFEAVGYFPKVKEAETQNPSPSAP
jgi:hypothetical protein